MLKNVRFFLYKIDFGLILYKVICCNKLICKLERRNIVTITIIF